MNGFEVASHARLKSKAEPNIFVAYWTGIEDWTLLGRAPYGPYQGD